MSKFETAQEISKKMESYFYDSKEAKEEYISKDILIPELQKEFGINKTKLFMEKLEGV